MADWPERARRLRSTESLVWVANYPYGFFGGLRTMMGAEEALMTCATDSELVEDINAILCNLYYVLWDRVMQETRVDEIYL